MAGSPLFSPYPINHEKQDIGRSKQDIEFLKQDIEILDEFPERINIPVRGYFLLTRKKLYPLGYNLIEHFTKRFQVKSNQFQRIKKSLK